MSIQACRMSVLSRYCGYDSFLRSDYISSVKIVVHIVNTVQTAGLFTGKPVGGIFHDRRSQADSLRLSVYETETSV